MDWNLGLFGLLVIYQFKHFFADYPLQGKYMLGKFKEKDWVLPLAAHAGVHALYTFVIAALCLEGLAAPVGLAAFDFVSHFAMDRLKASPGLLGRYRALSKGEHADAVALAASERSTYERLLGESRLRGNTFFWWALGFDQMVHHLTHYAIIAYIVTHS
jgi:hypothetical protein